MASPGFSIVFAPDVDQKVDHYWDGSNQVPIANAATATDTALFFATRAAANAALVALIPRYPTQHVAVVPATLTVAFAYPATPEVLGPSVS